MEILALPDAKSGSDSCVGVARDLARLSGGRWSVVQPLGGSWLNRALDRAPKAIAPAVDLPDAEYPASSRRAERRSPAAALERVVASSPIDLIVTPASRAHDLGSGWTFDELAETAGRPILATRGWPRIPPRSVGIVTEGRDLEHHVLGTVLDWMLPLTRLPAADGVVAPLELHLIHGIRAAFDWAPARKVVGRQLRDCVDRPGVVFRSARAEALEHLPREVARPGWDLTIGFLDLRGSSRIPRLGVLGRTLLEHSAGSVLLMPPNWQSRSPDAVEAVTSSTVG